MPSAARKLAFVLAATDHGSLILNRFDEHVVDGNTACGVGFQLLNEGHYEPEEVDLLRTLLELRRRHHGDGVVAVDCGANVGVHTVEWAKLMTGWGIVVAFEAQERIYYALAGNLALNNCFNARAIHAVVTQRPGTMKIPSPDYLAAASFGSLELRRRENTEFIGQTIDCADANLTEVRAVSLDSFDFPRLDLIKIDVEGMELEALLGGARSLARFHPILMVERIKCDQHKLRLMLDELGYSIFTFGLNFLAIHKSDRSLQHLQPSHAVGETTEAARKAS